MAQNCQSSLSRLMSFSAEMHGIHQLLKVTLETIDTKTNLTKPKHKKSILPIVDTGYIFVDGVLCLPYLLIGFSFCCHLLLTSIGYQSN